MGELIRNLDEINLGNEKLMIELNEGYSKNQGRVIHIQNKHFRFLMKEKDFVNLASTVMRAKSEMDYYKESQSKAKKNVISVNYEEADEVTKNVLLEVTDALNQENIRYRKLHDGKKFITLIINSDDYSSYKCLFKKIKGIKKIEHIYGRKFGYRFLYQMRPFEMYVKNKVFIEIFFQLPCLSLTPKTWIPIDRCVQELLWEKSRKEDEVIVPDYETEYIYRLCWAIFKNSSFSVNDVKRLKKLDEEGKVLSSESFHYALTKIFFNFADDLIYYLSKEKYEEIIPAYYIFDKY